MKDILKQMKNILTKNKYRKFNAKFPPDEEISSKILFLMNIILISSIGIKNDPLIYLLTDYREIQNFLKFNIKNTFNFIYFAKKKIHKILYDEDELINIEFDEAKNDLDYYFYLNLLINDNIFILTYKYSINFIKQINKIQCKNEKFKSIILAKIIIDLIKNYKQLEEYEEKEEKDILDDIENENENIIKNNLNILNEINLNINEQNIIVETIDEIYSKIMNSIIINEKTQDYEYTYKIIKQLNLEKIDITQIMLTELEKNLDEKNEYIKKYIITKKEDLYDEKKINFYYILLKFIIKNSIYIYQIPFLLKIRAIILKIIKFDQIIYNNMKENNKDKLQYIIAFMADSRYYFQNKNIKKLKEILNYYKAFLFESKKEDIDKIQDIIENNKKGYENYLKDYNKAKEMNLRLPIIKYLISSKELPNIEDETRIKQNAEKWALWEKMIKDKNLKKIRKGAKIVLENYFKDDNNKNILFQIFTQDEFDNFIKEIEEQKKNGNKNKNKKESNENKKQEEDYNTPNGDQNIQKQNEKNKIMDDEKTTLQNNQGKTTNMHSTIYTTNLKSGKQNKDLDAGFNQNHKNLDIASK